MEIRFYDPCDEYGWLANFSEHSILMHGRIWPTVEHYFQAQKFRNQALQERIRSAGSPTEAKRLAKELTSIRREDWTDVRELIMTEAIRAKFDQHHALADRLIATGDAKIVEDAPDDGYWGLGDGSGRNRMGELLMMLRSELVECIEDAA